jgi:hypothetical protein
MTGMCHCTQLLAEKDVERIRTFLPRLVSNCYTLDFYFPEPLHLTGDCEFETSLVTLQDHISKINK